MAFSSVMTHAFFLESKITDGLHCLYSTFLISSCIISVREAERNLHFRSSSLDLRNECDRNTCNYEMQLNELNIVQKVQRCKSSDIETGAPKVLEMKAKNFRHSIPMSNATITL